MTNPKLASPERITVYIDPDLEDIIPTFLANRQKDLQTLRTAMTEKDFETIRILGHRMRGDGGGYGFNAISDIGGVMEFWQQHDAWERRIELARAVTIF